jgi:hypothetical protein
MRLLLQQVSLDAQGASLLYFIFGSLRIACLGLPGAAADGTPIAAY